MDREAAGQPSSPAAVQGDDDRALMRRVAGRDRSALRELYQRHSAMVYAVSKRVLRDNGDAEQVLIDVFAQAWEQAQRFDADRGAVPGYLAMLARSRAIDAARARSRDPLHGATQQTRGEAEASDARQPDAVVAQPAQATLNTERDEMVIAALKTLEQRERTVVEMSFYEGLTHSQIAERLDRPIGTVKTQIRTGLLRMRETLRTYWEGGRAKP